MEISCKEEILIKKYLPRTDDLKMMSSFFYAFSDDTRLKIIILLMIKPLCVGDIGSFLNLNQTTVSHQLKILKALNIVEFERNKKNIIYYIQNKNIENILNIGVDCVNY